MHGIVLFRSIIARIERRKELIFSFLLSLDYFGLFGKTESLPYRRKDAVAKQWNNIYLKKTAFINYEILIAQLVRKFTLQISFFVLLLRDYARNDMLQLPHPELNVFHNITTATSCHYGHRNSDRSHIGALIYARHQNHVQQSGAIVFFSQVFFSYSFYFQSRTRGRPDRSFDRDIVLESAGIILTYIFPDRARAAPWWMLARRGEIFVRWGQFLKIKRPTLSLRAAINNNGRAIAGERAGAYLL